MAKLDKKLSEPSILVKPVSRFGGLDHIHIALIILAVILILLLLVMSYSTKIVVINTTQGANCTYGSINGTCTMPLHTSAQAKMAAESVLAGYSTTNSSLSLLPYISNVSMANVSYISSAGEWYVSIPYSVPYNSNTYTLGIIMQDSNLSRFSTYVQAIGGIPSITKNYVIAPGVIKLYQQTSCGTPATQMYWFTDPYAPGSIQSLVNATGLQAKYGSKINVSIKVLFTQYSVQVANTYGQNNTLNLPRYILCGSAQKNFTGFVKALNASYSGSYMPRYILSGIAQQSGFNMSSLNSCIANLSSGVMMGQFYQLTHFNVTSSSAVVTDCQYLSIPQTAAKAACYANNALC